MNRKRTSFHRWWCHVLVILAFTCANQSCANRAAYAVEAKTAPNSASPLTPSIVPGKLDADASRFADDIKSFEKLDQEHPPAKGGTVFAGSSTFTIWKDLESEFRDFHAINRGFGGSQISDVNYFFDRIITAYEPNAVVLYAGTNDIADGHSAQQVYRDFLKFSRHLKQVLPQAEAFYVSMSVAPSRMQWLKEYEKGNREIKAYCEKHPRWHYIDVTAAMRTSDGKLNEELFGDDRLHMNPRGYAVWTPVLRAALRRNLNEAR